MTAIFTAVLGLGVVIALFQLRAEERDRHIHWIFEINRVYKSWPVRKSVDALYTFDDPAQLEEKVRGWMKTQPPDPTLNREIQTLLELPNFLENVAITSRFARVNLELIWQSLSASVAYAWYMWEPASKLYQELDPEAFTEFGRLARRLTEYEKERETLGEASFEAPSYRAGDLTQRLVSYAVLLVVLTIVQIVVLVTR
jgi:hypothetical protein